MTQSFLTTEKTRQAAFKQTSPCFTDAARADGQYNRHFYPFCLPRECAAENLFADIRDAALAYFAAKRIPWHGGQNGLPSNHLCSSQVACVNFLYPFVDQPAALTNLLRPLYPTLDTILPIEDDGYVAFEWIGARNYLGERGKEARTRGANTTSADAALRFRHTDGRIQFILIEWKYTETYSDASYATAKSGTDRTVIYRHLYNRADFPLDKTLLPAFTDLFYEPFYQLFRQQCLAHEMELAREQDADIVSVLHIAPTRNHAFQRVTSPGLRPLGETVTEVWKRLIRQPDRFHSIATESLFASATLPNNPPLRQWQEYVNARYRDR